MLDNEVMETSKDHNLAPAPGAGPVPPDRECATFNSLSTVASSRSSLYTKPLALAILLLICGGVVLLLYNPNAFSGKGPNDPEAVGYHVGDACDYGYVEGSKVKRKMGFCKVYYPRFLQPTIYLVGKYVLGSQKCHLVRENEEISVDRATLVTQFNEKSMLVVSSSFIVFDRLGNNLVRYYCCCCFSS